MGFLDNIFGGDDNESKKKKSGNNSNSNNNNPLAKVFSNMTTTTTKSFQGQGQSLGGNKPGQVIAVTFEHTGPLGIKVERKSNSTASAIVNYVMAGSPAETAGIQRGDILCFAGSNGQEEIMYEVFLELVQSGQRPLRE
jgi:predicted metalloprotease with PDZ domain